MTATPRVVTDGLPPGAGPWLLIALLIFLAFRIYFATR